MYKISDESRGTKPFDMFHMKETPAYIVIRYPDVFVLIAIADFVTEMNRYNVSDCRSYGKKSLTRDRAIEICSFKQLVYGQKRVGNKTTRNRGCSEKD